MSLFKRAAARGVAYELVRRGAVDFMSKEAMDEVADAVSDHMMGGMPDLSEDEGHDPEELAALAEQLLEIAHQLKAEGGEGGAPKMASENLKVAMQNTDFNELAFMVAADVMQKAASETALVGAGTHSENTESNAASNNDVAKLDLKNRSEGQYEVGKGNTTLDTSPGEVGQLKQPTVSPTNSVSGTNSVNEDSKKASLNNVRKIATALLMGHTPQNTEAHSAQHNDVARLDLQHRPEGYAVVPKGGANFSEPQSARIGEERKPDVMPSNTPGGSNSVTHASKAAADQALYLDLFRKTAADVGPYLPTTLTDDQKLAAIQQMMPLDREHRAEYLNTLKQASSEGFEAMMKDVKDIKHMEKKEHKDEKAEEKKEEKDEGKKESALIEQIRAMARSASAYR